MSTLAAEHSDAGPARPVQGRTIAVFGDKQFNGRGMTAIAIDTLVTVFGGSGFLGRHVVRALAKRGYRIRVAVRRPDLAGHLQPLGRVGQIHAVQANVRYPGSVEAAAVTLTDGRELFAASSFFDLPGKCISDEVCTFDEMVRKP